MTLFISFTTFYTLLCILPKTCLAHPSSLRIPHCAVQVTEEVRDGQRVTVSLESGHQVTWAEEDNYLFPMSRLQDDLRYWVRNRKSCGSRGFGRASPAPLSFHDTGS